jgi:anti-sigma regulatory factor (Ser/Thr protein kinase)
VRVPAEERRLQADLLSVAAARRFVRELLGRWRAADYEWVASQVVSELVTNAVIHARTDFVVALSLDDGILRVAVTDSSSRRPVRRHYSDEATTGRGLALVERLAGRWGVDLDGSHKTVWCELSSEAPGPVGDADLDAYLDVFGEPAGDRPHENGGSVLARAA